jgi:hypothetical protein
MTHRNRSGHYSTKCCFDAGVRRGDFHIMDEDDPGIRRLSLEPERVKLSNYRHPLTPTAIR